MTRRVIPYLKRRVGDTSVIKAKVLRTCVIGESQIDTRISDLMTGGNPTVGLAAHSGQVDVRITAKAVDEAGADKLIASVESELRARLGSVIYGEGTETLEDVVARLLAERGMTLALVDRVTAGEVASRLGNTPHPDVLVLREYPMGEPASDNSVATRLESESTTKGPQAMAGYLASHARSNASASLGLALFSTTQQGEGVRPLAHLSLSDDHQTVTRSYQFGGKSKLTRRWLSIRALDLVRRYLIGALDDEID
jgi:nicotinamide-nucleotide amidase